MPHLGAFGGGPRCYVASMLRHPEALDHVVLATTDIAETCVAIARATGVSPSAGGAHVGKGTRNALCALGDGTYLEVIGLDPDQPEPPEPRPFAIDRLVTPGVVTWCARRRHLAALVAAAAEAGLPFTGPVPMQRESPEGLLSWELALPAFETEAGVVPFFIDWGNTPHPSMSASIARGLRLESFRLHHPEPERIARWFDTFAIDAEPIRADAPGLDVVLAGPAGSLRLPVASFR